jgi:chromate transporter
MIYLILFFEYFKVGLFAVGGGLATLPFLYELIAKYGWFDAKELTNMIAVSESTPGPMGVNMSTYAGFLATGGFPQGILGGIVATMGLVTPSIIVILIVSYFLIKFKNSPIVQKVFYGLRPASMGLIAAAGFSVIKTSLLNIEGFETTKKILDLFNIKAIIFAILLYVAIEKFKKHPALYILIAAIAGVLIKF